MIPRKTRSFINRRPPATTADINGSTLVEWHQTGRAVAVLKSFRLTSWSAGERRAIDAAIEEYDLSVSQTKRSFLNRKSKVTFAILAFRLLLLGLVCHIIALPPILCVEFNCCFTLLNTSPALRGLPCYPSQSNNALKFHPL